MCISEAPHDLAVIDSSDLGEVPGQNSPLAYDFYHLQDLAPTYDDG